MNLNFLIIFFLSFTCFGCYKKCPKRKVEYINLTDISANDYFNFTKGSFWIYKNTFENTTDSLYIIDDYKNSRVLLDDDNCQKFEFSHIQTNGTKIFNGVVNGVLRYETNRIENSTELNVNINKQGIVEVLGRFIKPINGPFPSNIYPNMVVNGKLYSDIIKYEARDTSRLYYIDSYFAKGIGLIKFDKLRANVINGKVEIIDTTSSIELINYKIVQ